MPRFMIFVRASAEAETEFKPDADLLKAMGDYNASMVEAGIMHLAEGLHPSSNDGRRIVFHDGSAQPDVVKGPFPPEEMVAGFWIIQVKDIDEATKWAVKCPFQEGGVKEIRRIAALEEFGDAFTPEMQQKEEKLRTKAEKLAKGA